MFIHCGFSLLSVKSVCSFPTSIYCSIVTPPPSSICWGALLHTVLFHGYMPFNVDGCASAAKKMNKENTGDVSKGKKSQSASLTPQPLQRNRCGNLYILNAVMGVLRQMDFKVR